MPVGMLTWVKLAPASVDRKSPALVAARMMELLVGLTCTSRMEVEVPNSIGVDQVVPPFVVFTKPMPVPSKASPRPR